MAEEKKFEAKMILTPLPVTERGFATKIYGTAKGEPRMTYCNGNEVIVRSLDDPSKGFIFTGHKAKVNVARFSPNGEWIASGDETGKVIVWGTKNMNIKNEVAAIRSVVDIDWSADGQRIAAVGEGKPNMGRVFSWDSGNSLGEASGHSKKILSVAYKPTRPFRLATGSEDMTFRFYEGPPFKPAKENNCSKAHSNYVNCVAFSPDGSQYITVGTDRKMFVMDGKTGEQIKEIEAKEDGHEGAILSLSFSPDGSQFLTASMDKTAKLWDSASHELIKTFKFGDSLDDMQVGSLWVGEHMVTVSLSGALNFLDMENPDVPKRIVHGHKGTINNLVVDRANNLAFSACSDGRVTKWDLATGAGVWLSGNGHANKGVSDLALTSDGSQIVTVGLDDQLRVNDLSSGTFADAGVPVGGFPTAVAASSSDSSLAVVCVAQGKVAVVRGGQIASSLDVSYRPNCVAISNNNALVAVGGDDNKVHVYALSGDSLGDEFTLEHTHGITTVAFSGDDSLLYAGDKGYYSRFWTVASRENNNKSGWRFHRGMIRGADFSSDNSFALSSCMSGHVIQWNDLSSFSGSKRRMFEFAHPMGIVALKRVSDSSFVTASTDGTIRLWDL